MPTPFQVRVMVPVTNATNAAIVTQKLQEATTIQKRIGAWVVRGRDGDPFTGGVLVDFSIEADTLEEAEAQALAWTRAELTRGNAIGGIGEPTTTGMIS